MSFLGSFEVVEIIFFFLCLLEDGDSLSSSRLRLWPADGEVSAEEDEVEVEDKESALAACVLAAAAAAAACAAWAEAAWALSLSRRIRPRSLRSSS